MKNFILAFFISLSWVLGQDSTYANPAADSLTVTNTIQENSGVQRLNLEDFKKFYIGFTSSDHALEVITLNISDIAGTDSSYNFNYTLNTHNNREDGNGQIWPERSLIRFQNMEEGRISIPDDGKIVFESVSMDTLNYWKLKEK